MAIRKYPLSAANGRAIPADVFGPVSYNAQAITTSVLGTLVRDESYEEHLLSIYSDQDALITFSEDATIGAEDTEVFWLLANTFYLLVPLKEYYDIHSISVAGTANINTVTRWDTLTTELQVDQG